MVIIAFNESFFNTCCVFGRSALVHRRIKIACHTKQAIGISEL